ncbi:MAG: 16S rRNA (uracil(1498)-N(3))-methyltransferase [Candidatus Latescibacteria bacterium]|nr:16S rRNA (uracil(1498)-N(3))-methyltransferase [Candidatus Latescibacterota bacterium]MCB9516900.1 16S rRNA (uracil(1498)-N(3))-methyltransferase [Candidatus Latescibacterota bacterium]
MSEAPVLLWPELAGPGTLVLDGPAQHYLCNVLRLRAGDAVELRDGRGAAARGRLTAVERRRATLELEAPQALPVPPGPRLHLAMPLLKGRRLDWALEKCTELGVSDFHLYVGRHGVVRRDRAPERYGEILRAAFAQCRRPLLPALDGPAPFADLLSRATTEGWRQAWADERGAGRGQAPFALADGEDLLAWVGPEGGFSAEERAALEAAASLRLDLGAQRLRAETAAVAATCALLLPRGETKPPAAR